MKVKRRAQAGSFESSDILVIVEPVEDNTGRQIELDSSVMLQFGDSIREEITTMLDRLDISDVKLIARDKGALHPTICARVETALKRSLGIEEGTLLSNE